MPEQELPAGQGHAVYRPAASYIVGSMIGVFVYGTIESAISVKGADQWWTKISVGLLLLAFIGAQRVIVVRSQRRRS